MCIHLCIVRAYVNGIVNKSSEGILRYSFRREVIINDVLLESGTDTGLPRITSKNGSFGASELLSPQHSVQAENNKNINK